MRQNPQNPLINAAFAVVLLLATVLHGGLMVWQTLNHQRLPLVPPGFWLDPGLGPTHSSFTAYLLVLLAYLARRERQNPGEWRLAGLSTVALWGLVWSLGWLLRQSDLAQPDFPGPDYLSLTLALSGGMAGVVGLVRTQPEPLAPLVQALSSLQTDQASKPKLGPPLGKGGIAASPLDAAQSPRLEGLGDRVGILTDSSLQPKSRGPKPAAGSGEAPSAPSRAGERELVLGAVREAGQAGVSPKAVVQKTGLGRNRVFDLLQELVDRGEVVKSGQGRWAVYRLSGPQAG